MTSLDSSHRGAAFTQHYPNSTVVTLSPWNSFPGTVFLSPQDPMYQTIGTLFIQVQTQYYGTVSAIDPLGPAPADPPTQDHYYNCDPFNEVEPQTNDPAWLAASGKAIVRSSALSAAPADVLSTPPC